jgi:integrase/recombinase XerD
MTGAGESGTGSELEVLAAPARWSGESAAAHVAADRGLAIGRLPGNETLDPFLRLAAAFLAEYAGHSRRAYQADLQAWADWCAHLGVHPFDARRHHIAAWNEQMTTAGSARTGKPMAPASIARRLSCVSKFYSHGIGVEVLDHSPVANARRPRVSDDSTTIGLSADELLRLLDAAEAHSTRFYALVSLLSYNGLRIAEALAADVDDYTWQRSRRVLRITRKGGRRSTEYVAPPTVDALDTYLTTGHPPTGPLFLATNGSRLSYQTAYEQIRRLAVKAGIPAGLAITPHSLRHTFVTEALAAGVPLQDVQDAAGHKDPRTTRRYDRTRLHPDRHPAYVLATHLQRQRSAGDPES